ncbi:MAG: protein phosphatase 2C domain-containing protein [Armatimonadetes bacterium]|nr:protein phosphatase 2C domain-containing protein [Armatimonadota bacterium]
MSLRCAALCLVALAWACSGKEFASEATGGAGGGGTGGSAGETWFLTQPDWRDRATVADWTPEAAGAITMWLLMTDGVADDALYPPPADILDRFGQGLAKELQAPRPLAATAQRLLTWLASYERPGSFDDRTLLAVWRSGQE